MYLGVLENCSFGENLGLKISSARNFQFFDSTAQWNQYSEFRRTLNSVFRSGLRDGKFMVCFCHRLQYKTFDLYQP